MMTPFRRDLEYFLILCETLQISSAAEKAGIQQAGLSKSLKQLESEFTEPLFYRSSRGLKLTPIGLLLKKNLMETMSGWEKRFGNEVKQLQACVGKLTIGLHPTVAISCLSVLYPKLCEMYPGVNIELQLKKSMEVTKDVVGFQLDIGIVADPQPHPDLVITPLGHESIGVWQNSKRGNSKTLYYNPEMIQIIQTIKKYKNYKKIEVGDYEVLASFLKNSDGLGILPSPIAQRNKELVQVGRDLRSVKICMIHRYDIMKTQAFKEISRQIKQHFSMQDS